MQDVYLQHAALAGERVNRHLRAGRAVGKVVERSARQGGFVVVDFGRTVKAVTPQLNAVGVGEFHNFIKRARRFGRDHTPAFKAHGTRSATVQPAHKCSQVVADIARRKLGGAAIQVSACGCCGRGSIGNFAGVTCRGQHALKRHAELIGNDLADFGVQSLAHFGATVVHLHAAVQVNVNQRTGLIEQRGGKADAKLDRRDGDAALDGRVTLVPHHNLLLLSSIIG